MREIKFRAWNLVFKRMSPEHAEFHFNGEHSHLHFDVFNGNFDTDVWDFSECELMQYTGLKDKNGVEIYEGDICKCNYFNGSKVKQHTEVVEFKNGQFELTWTINNLFKSFRSRSCFHGHSDAFEIIGNIHENPELLKAPN